MKPTLSRVQYAYVSGSPESQWPEGPLGYPRLSRGYSRSGPGLTCVIPSCPNIAHLSNISNSLPPLLHGRLVFSFSGIQKHLVRLPPPSLISLYPQDHLLKPDKLHETILQIIMSTRSWAATISLLFQTPMIPTENEIVAKKPAEIPMMDMPSPTSPQSPVSWSDCTAESWQGLLTSWLCV